MNILRITIFGIFILISASQYLYSQSNIQSYTFKKGEILDILLLSKNSKGGAFFDQYKKTAFPHAVKRSYQPIPGYKITETTQGNQQPENLVLAKWNNLENREKFIDEIEALVPDFHEQRRTIWSIFNLTYYEMSDDITFRINKDKCNVVTAYWGKNLTDFQKFKQDWLKTSNDTGGETILELANGQSPLGYYYNPDYLVITQWENRAAFETFYKKNLRMNHKGVLHMNQFIIN
ncbi:hypothetical protein AB832_04885 [Flavobacteriaceae bacterium (ex Bugula neritina AB1)]|nr:hypothetical protein AB832_04885 [Flavobacteriaceae bacterium (ex Bugula neritina AB1)]